ncbi:hypothetical protein ACN28S_16275 [Cystobacter fuscus]
MINSTAANSGAPPVREVTETVVDAARYSTVPSLMDSLLHDVRNPLNAMSIHLEVLTEKLKVDGRCRPRRRRTSSPCVNRFSAWMAFCGVSRSSS